MALDSARETMTIKSLVDFVEFSEARGAVLQPQDNTNNTSRGVRIKLVTKSMGEGKEHKTYVKWTRSRVLVGRDKTQTCSALIIREL